jgi:hypothetical protein
VENEVSKQLSEPHLRLKAHKGLPEVREYYRHYNGGLYWCMGVGIHEKSLVPMVAYKDVDLKYPEVALWFRDVDSWNECVVVKGGQVPRFALAGPIKDAEADLLAGNFLDMMDAGWSLQSAIKNLDYLIPDDRERVWRMVLERMT